MADISQIILPNGTTYNLKDSRVDNLDSDDVGAIAAPSSASTGDFLVYNGTAWVAQSLSTWQGGSY